MDSALREFIRATPPPDNAHLVPGSEARAAWAEARAKEIRRWYGLPVALPSATPVPGPAIFRKFANRRTRRKVGRDNHDVELIAFRKVVQHLTDVLSLTEYMNGFFKGWIMDEKGSYIGQLYEDGENCKGFHPRKTRVDLLCWPNTTGPQLYIVDEVEVSPCNYVLSVAHADVCEFLGKPAKEVD